MFAFEPNSAFLDLSSSEAIPPAPSQPAPVKPIRRRDKPQLSCTICRQKKLKCDRVKPCLNCTKRGQPESCDYIKYDSSRKTTNVQDRVRQLEEMVKSLLKNQKIADQHRTKTETSPSASSLTGPVNDGGFTQSEAASPHSQTGPGVPKVSLGKFTKAKDQDNFVGSEHWEAILEDITELKIDLETPDTSKMANFKPQILFGMNHASRAEIMSSIPPKPVCDMLISRWAKTMGMAPMVVHMPTFMKEYNQMFKEPNETPLMWIGLLFAILGLASHFYAVSGDDLRNMPESFTSTKEMSRHFRDRTAQCLVEVNYLRPKRYTLETLCFYCALEKFQFKDSEFGSYVILGMLIRVAMRLGYHRDASHYPSISPFDGEMRRRVWSIVFQLDMITSAQIGLPRMIREEETDTAEPKNLLDTDFDDNMTELPPPRPSTDVTPVAYSIFMVRILRHLGLVVDQINSITPPSYDEVMRLDSQLLETHATFPQYLTMRSLNLSITDDAEIILRRFALEVCFQKSRCLLHRKYLILGKTNPQFRYSRVTSVDAAMKLLDVQHNFYEATQPGGQMYSEQWRTMALVNQDYVLAAMILCLDLAWDMKMEQCGPSDEEEIESKWPRNERLQKIKGSYDIWCKSSEVSSLAAKAAGTLRVMLNDLNFTDSLTVPTILFPNPTSISGTLSGLCIHAHNAEPSADATPVPQLPVSNDQSFLGASNNLDFNSQYFASATDFLTGTDTDMNFDWGLWDSQFQETVMPEEDFDSLAFHDIALK